MPNGNRPRHRRRAWPGWPPPSGWRMPAAGWWSMNPPGRRAAAAARCTMPSWTAPIDNGNHLLLGGNTGVFGLLDRIGARDRLIGADPLAFPFMDLSTGEHWSLRPNLGPVPWWMLAPSRRVPGTGWRDYLGLLKLLRAPKRRHGGGMPGHQRRALQAALGAAGGRGAQHRSRTWIGPADGSGGRGDLHEGRSGLPAFHRRARPVRYLRRSVGPLPGSARRNDPAAVAPASPRRPERPRHGAGVRRRNGGHRIGRCRGARPAPGGGGRTASRPSRPRWQHRDPQRPLPPGPPSIAPRRADVPGT